MFRSFFLAGFEGSTGYNRHGDWFDQVVATGHDRTVEQDYRDLAALGIWSVAGSGPLAAGGPAARPVRLLERRPLPEPRRGHGIEVIWDLFHYGYPARHRPFRGRSARTIRRLLLRGCGRYIGTRSERPAASRP